MEKLEAKDICVAFLHGYMYCTITERLINGKIYSSDLDKLNCMNKQDTKIPI